MLIEIVLAGSRGRSILFNLRAVWRASRGQERMSTFSLRVLRYYYYTLSLSLSLSLSLKGNFEGIR